MADTEWARLALGAATSLLSGLGGLLVGVWRAGRKSAEHDHIVKQREQTLKDELMERTNEIEKASERRLDLLVEQFKESFVGLRRTIDDDRLRNEQTFLRKEDFRDFREEYRQDIRDIKESIKDLAKH